MNMLFTMIIEQTKEYSKRMIYTPDTNSFMESEYDSLAFRRGFLQPYGWIKESGTPPQPHWDVILMAENTDKIYQLGEKVAIKVIGVFKRSDGDHKYIAVEAIREIDDYIQLNDDEKEDLKRLYPVVGMGEGWFDHEEAMKCMIECEKAV